MVGTEANHIVELEQDITSTGFLCEVALPTTPEALVERVRIAAEPVMEQLGYPNSYTLTKCLAEHLLVASARTVTVKLVRPSIVAAAWQWPEPGGVAASSALPAVQAAMRSAVESVTEEPTLFDAPPR